MNILNTAVGEGTWQHVPHPAGSSELWKSEEKVWMEWDPVGPKGGREMEKKGKNREKERGRRR